MFAVPRAVIHRRALAFYWDCLDLIEDDIESNEDMGYIFERLWFLIFGVEAREGAQ